MLYSLKAIIKNVNTEEKIERVLVCEFTNNKEDYGNGYYLSIKCPDHPEEYFPHLDIRYDTTFDPDNMGAYLAEWAYDYWAGEGTPWKLNKLTIKEVD